VLKVELRLVKLLCVSLFTFVLLLPFCFFLPFLLFAFCFGLQYFSFLASFCASFFLNFFFSWFFDFFSLLPQRWLAPSSALSTVPYSAGSIGSEPCLN